MRLIDADALIAEYDRVHIGPPGGARKLMEDAPTIDPEDLRPKGRWVMKDSQGNGVCSHCNRQDHIDPLATHCRYCGAKMEVNV